MMTTLALMLTALMISTICCWAMLSLHILIDVHLDVKLSNSALASRYILPHWITPALRGGRPRKTFSATLTRWMRLSS